MWIVYISFTMNVKCGLFISAIPWTLNVDCLYQLCHGR